MACYPTQNEIKLWTSEATGIFQFIMPPVNKPFPRVYIATAKTFSNMRAELIAQTGCTYAEEGENAIMEYIHGDTGYTILIRQNLITDKNQDHFNAMLWHELGHFYAINSERTKLRHYSDPAIVDDSKF